MPTTKSTPKSSTSASSKAKRPAHPAGSAAHPDAVQLLVNDHKEVKKLFKDFEKLVKEEAEGTEKQALALQICKLLKVHTAIEEEIFYPAARASLSEQDLLDEAEVEHASAKELIQQIESMEPDEELYDAKVTVLGEYIDHHVKEEETELFPKVKKAKVDVDQLGEEMATRKEELLAEEDDQAVH